MSRTSLPALRRTVTVAVTALVLGTFATTAAQADEPSPTPKASVAVDGDQVTLTTDLATAQALCARVDTARDRLTGLRDRISAAADTTGSSAWLLERAQRATDAGHDDQARRLEDRADRRADRLDEIGAALSRLDLAVANVCAALPGSGE